MRYKRAVIITGQHFQDEEYVYPYYRLLEAGFHLDIAIKDDLINAGAEYLDKDVVIDDNFVSSPHYKNNGDFMREILKKFDQ